MRRKRCKTQAQGTSPMALLTKLLVVEEPGLSRWPWTLEHASSNLAYQTTHPLGFKVKHDTFNIGKKEHYLQGVRETVTNS